MCHKLLQFQTAYTVFLDSSLSGLYMYFASYELAYQARQWRNFLSFSFSPNWFAYLGIEHKFVAASLPSEHRLLLWLLLLFAVHFGHSALAGHSGNCSAWLAQVPSWRSSWAQRKGSPSALKIYGLCQVGEKLCLWSNSSRQEQEWELAWPSNTINLIAS